MPLEIYSALLNVPSTSISELRRLRNTPRLSRVRPEFAWAPGADEVDSDAVKFRSSAQLVYRL